MTILKRTKCDLKTTLDQQYEVMLNEVQEQANSQNLEFLGQTITTILNVGYLFDAYTLQVDRKDDDVKLQF